MSAGDREGRRNRRASVACPRRPRLPRGRRSRVARRDALWQHLDGRAAPRRAALDAAPRCEHEARRPMKITEVRTIPLSGATHDTGWPGGTKTDEQMNTLVEVTTDEGLIGIGSCFTSQALVEAALQLLRPMLIGETGLEPERVAEKLRQIDLLAGPRRQRRARDQRHRHRAVGPPGAGARAARLAAPRRQLSRPHQALRLDPVRRSARPARQAPAPDRRAASGRSRWAGGRSAASAGSSTSC